MAFESDNNNKSQDLNNNNSDNKSLPIFQVPQEIFTKNIPLGIEDIKNLKLACKGFSFFRYQSQQNSPRKGDAYLLMDMVTKFRFKEAKEIARGNPACIVEKICYDSTAKFIPDANLPLISPLQQAFLSLDSYTWNMFYETIKNDDELLKIYTQQIKEIDSHFDIQPLIKAYDDYLNHYARHKRIDWKNKDDTATQTALDLLKKVREAQDNLPMHMIYEMCRPNAHLIHELEYDNILKKEYFQAEFHTWLYTEKESILNCLNVLQRTPPTNQKEKPGDFSINTNPPPPAKIILFYEGEGCISPVNNLCELEKIEKKYLGALVRGDFVQGAYAAIGAGTLVGDDKKLLEMLYNTRLEEFRQHKKMLSQNSNDLKNRAPEGKEPRHASFN